MAPSRFDRVGFIGLGAMGKPMVEQLAAKLPKESRILVFDIFKPVMDDLEAKYPGKIIQTKSAQEVARQSDTLFTMLPEGAHVRTAYLAPETGICAIDLSYRTLIDCSTIDIATNLAVKEHIAKNFPSSSFYDAPVSGGVLGAEKGSIAIFLGCAEDDPNITKLREILSLMGKSIIPCGGPSFGLAAKLSNNYLSGLIAIAASEALDMGMRVGLDPRVLSQVFAAGTGQNTICDKFNPVPGVAPGAPSSSGYKGGFKVQLMKKDFSLAIDMATKVGSKLALGEAGLKTYEGASNDTRCRDLDSRVVFRYLGGNEDWKVKFDDKKAWIR